MLARQYEALKKSLGNDLEARRIIEARTAYRWADIMAQPEAVIELQALALIESDMQRRIAGEPLSRIYGMREFWGREFALSPDTLDPRPETELIIELALKRFKGMSPARILDLGTGTGCILITLLAEFPDSTGVACDLSAGALATARENAARHGVESRAQFIESDWFSGVEGEFDLIVSNPPYIAESVIPTLAVEVKNHDPILALQGGEDGLQAYRQIFSKLFLHLKPAGIALFEIGFDQGEEVMRLSGESRIRQTRVHSDLAGLARVLEISSET